MKKYITAIYKPGVSITKVLVNRMNWETIAQVKAYMDMGYEYYTQSLYPAKVYIYVDRYGHMHLSTRPDRLEQNNLLSLPNKA